MIYEEANRSPCEGGDAPPAPLSFDYSALRSRIIEARQQQQHQVNETEGSKESIYFTVLREQLVQWRQSKTTTKAQPPTKVVATGMASPFPSPPAAAAPTLPPSADKVETIGGQEQNSDSYSDYARFHLTALPKLSETYAQTAAQREREYGRRKRAYLERQERRRRQGRGAQVGEGRPPGCQTPPKTTGAGGAGGGSDNETDYHLKRMVMDVAAAGLRGGRELSMKLTGGSAGGSSSGMLSPPLFASLLPLDNEGSEGNVYSNHPLHASSSGNNNGNHGNAHTDPIERPPQATVIAQDDKQSATELRSPLHNYSQLFAFGKSLPAEKHTNALYFLSDTNGKRHHAKGTFCHEEEKKQLCFVELEHTFSSEDEKEHEPRRGSGDAWGGRSFNSSSSVSVAPSEAMEEMKVRLKSSRAPSCLMQEATDYLSMANSKATTTARVSSSGKEEAEADMKRKKRLEEEEINAIYEGKAAPYLSYIFSPNNAVEDLNTLPLKAAVHPASPVASPATSSYHLPEPQSCKVTCIRFFPASTTQYIMGMSSGMLWCGTLPGSHTIQATFLGSILVSCDAERKGESTQLHLYPSEKTARKTQDAGLPSLKAAAATRTATAGATAAASAPPALLLQHDALQQQQPQQGGNSSAGGTAPSLCPLEGHNGAITSICFSDDSAMFATSAADSSIIIWSSAKRTKLRRMSAFLLLAHPRVAAAQAQSREAQRGGGASGAAGRTDGSSGGAHGKKPSAAVASPSHIAFMPLNNNYVVATFEQSNKIVLYNCSTGLAVSTEDAGRRREANAAAAGAQRTAAAQAARGTGAVAAHPPGDTTAAKGAVTRRREKVTTAVAIDRSLYPYFFTGSDNGDVWLWTARGGTLPAPPLLRPSKGAGGQAGAVGGAGADLADDLRGDGLLAQLKLPELRRVARLSLQPAVDAILARHHAPPLGQHTNASMYAISKIELQTMNLPQAERILEATQPVLLPYCSKPFFANREENRNGSDNAAAAGQPPRPTPQQRTARREGAPGRGAAAPAPTAKGVEENLTVFANKISDTFSSWWSSVRGEAAAAGAGAAAAPAPGASATRTKVLASAPTTHVPPSAAAAAPTPPLAPQQPVLSTEQLCSVTALVSVPCDMLFMVGIVADAAAHPPARPRRSAEEAAATPTAGEDQEDTAMLIRYHVAPLLYIFGGFRLRHVGRGAALSRDNPRLLVCACPCEEGFVKVLALPGRGSAATPLATLVVPFGGACEQVVWSPDGHSLLATTADGYLYQWTRVYLLTEVVERAAPGPRDDTKEKEEGKQEGREVLQLMPPAVASRAGSSSEQEENTLHAGSTGTARVPERTWTEGWVLDDEERWRQSLLRERERLWLRKQKQRMEVEGSEAQSSDRSAYWMEGSTRLSIDEDYGNEEEETNF